MRKIKIIVICVISIAIIITLFEYFTHHEINDVDNISFIDITKLHSYNQVDGYIADDEDEIKSVNKYFKRIHFFHRKDEQLINWYSLDLKQDMIIVIKYKDGSTRHIETDGYKAVIFNKIEYKNPPSIEDVKCYYVNPLEIKMFLNHFISEK